MIFSGVIPTMCGQPLQAEQEVPEVAGQNGVGLGQHGPAGQHSPGPGRNNIIIRRPASALLDKLLCPPGPGGPATAAAG